MSHRALTAVVLLGLGVVLLWPSRAGAQSASRWEFEGHGGWSFGSGGSDGTGSLPAAGQGFTTLTLLSSRHASSWYFGDGATLLNQANAAFTSPSTSGRITALDAVLAKASSTRNGGASFGFRLGYAITPRLSAEFNLDSTQTSLEFTNEFLAGVEASRASFVTAWNGLLSTGGGIVFTNTSVTSTLDITPKGGRQLATTGALVFNLATDRPVVPYLTVGAGVTTSAGDFPQLTLVGNYRFTSLNALSAGTFPANETDTVVLRVVSRTAFTTVLGGGVKIERSPRWGIRADARAHIGGNGTDLLVDAHPNVQIATPAGAIASTVTPSMQFSNNPATGFQSSLSGPAIEGFRVFKGSGTAVQFNVTAGIFFRF